MKFVIAAVAIAVATPALASKPMVKPVQAECNATITALQNQIMMMKKQLAMAEARTNKK